MYFSQRVNFVNFFSHSPAGLIISEADTGKMVEVNDRFCSIVGYSKRYLLGKTSIEAGILTAEQRQYLTSMIHEEGRLLNVELPITNSANERVWILMSVDLIDIRGKKYNLTTTFDITQNKNDHDALIASETKYHSIFENSLAGIIVSEIETFKVLDANIVAARMFGYQSSEDFIKNYDASRHYVNPADKHQIRERLLKEPEVSNSVIAMRRLDGTPVFVKIFARTEPGISNRITVVIDVTTEVLQFQELEQRKEHYRLMFDNMREAFVVMDPVTDESGNFIDARFVEINPAAEKAIGVSRTELIGKLRSETLGRFSPERITHFNSVLHSNEPVTEQVFFEHSGKWMEGRTYVQDGRLITIAFDITKRKEAEQRLEEEWSSTQFLNEALHRLWNIQTMKEGLEEILSTSIRLLAADKGNVQLLNASRSFPLVRPRD